MKTKLLITLLMLTAISAIVIKDGFSKKDGIEGRVGSAGETTCLTSGCHTGNALNATGGSIVISSPDLNNFVYTPGVTYTINVTVSKTGVGLFGFAMEALRSTGANAGSFVHTFPTQTQSKTATANGRTSATHLLNAGLSTNSKTFTFNWVAPATNVGTVTFYAGGNAANNNGTAAGDFIYTTSQLVHDSATVSGISQPVSVLEGVNIFPNPVSSVLGISLNTIEKENVKIELYNLAGQFQDLLLVEPETAGIHKYSFDVSQRYSGLYLLKVTAGSKISVKKVYFQ